MSRPVVRQVEFGLLPAAAAVWLGSAAGLWFGAGGPYLLIATVLAAAWLAWRRLLPVGLLAVLAVAVGFAGLRWLQFASALPADLPSRSEIVFELMSDPVSRLDTRSLDLSTEVTANADVLWSADLELVRPLPVFAISAGSPELAAADITSRWRCTASLRPVAGLRRYLAYAECEEPPTRVRAGTRAQSVAGDIRAALRELTVARRPGDGAALLPGLVVGDTSGQSQDLTAQLQAAGLGHLTAVSGANVGFVLAAAVLLMRAVGVAGRRQVPVLVLVLLAFILIARPSPSVVRAGLMAGLGLLVVFLGSARRTESLLLASVVVLLLVDPWLSVNWGFALSVAATAGLVLLPRWWQPSSPVPLWWRGLTTAAAAGLATLPLLVAMGVGPSFASLPANLLAEVLVGPATVAGLAAAVSGWLGQLMPAPLGSALWLVGSLAADIGMVAAAGIAKIADAAVDSPLQVPVWSPLGVAVVAAGWMAWRKFRPSRPAGFAALLISIAVGLTVGSRMVQARSAWPPSDWQIAACDVGQGDATVVRLQGDAAMLIDTGPDPRLLEDCLDRLGVRRIQFFVATHFHADHIGAIGWLSRNLPPEAALLNPATEPAAGRVLTETALSGADIRWAQPGDQGDLGGANGGVVWQVLQVANFPGADGSAVNNGSIVLRVVAAGIDLLLTADVEVDAQALLQRIAPMHPNLVKVPHHGSAAQHPDFARWLSAPLAWVSVGRENDYGHPAPATISGYRAAGSAVLATADCGGIAFSPGPAGMRVTPAESCRPD